MAQTFNLWGLGSASLGTAGKFALTRDTDNQWWNTSTVGYEAFNAGNIANYAIAATETGTGTGVYTASNPDATLTASRALLIEIAGGSMVQSDLTDGLLWEEPVGYLLTNPAQLNSSTFTFAGPYLGTSNSITFNGAFVEVDVEQLHTQSVFATGSVTFPAGLVASTTNISSGTITTVTNQLTAAAIATAHWQDTTAGDFTVSGSPGKILTQTDANGLLKVDTEDLRGTLGVASPGYVALDWAQTGHATAGVNLSGTSLGFIDAGGIDSPSLTTAAYNRIQLNLATTAQLGSVSIGASGLDSPAFTSAAITRLQAGLATAAELGSVSLGTSGADSPAFTNNARSFLQSGLATPTNIVSGTLTTLSGNVQGSVSGSLGGSVLGNVVGSVGSINGVTFPAGFSSLTTASIATAVLTDTSAGDTSVSGSLGKIVVGQLGGAFGAAGSSTFTASALQNAPTASVGSVSIGTAGLDSPAFTSNALKLIQAGLATAAELASVSVGANGIDSPALTTAAYNRIQLNLATAAELGAVTLGVNGADSSAFTPATYNQIVSVLLVTMVPVTGNTPNSVADCYNAARAQAFGAWDFVSGSPSPTLALYGPDGVTVARLFNLNSDTPSIRS